MEWRRLCIAVVLVFVLTALSPVVQPASAGPSGGSDPPPSPPGPPGSIGGEGGGFEWGQTGGVYLPSSQTLVNGTQTAGNCGSLWTDLNLSDDVKCSYQEVDRSPADQLGLVVLADGKDVNGWVAGTGTPCATNDTAYAPWVDLDDGADANDGDATCRQGSTNGDRAGVTLQNPALTDPTDADDYTVVTSAVVEKVSGSPASVSIDVKVGTSAYANGATQTTTTSYVRYSRTDATDPTTNPSTEWTLTDVNGLVAGVRCVDCSPNNRVTQVQAKVDALYNPEYALEVRFSWSGVPTVGDAWYLVSECSRLNSGAENVTVEVGQGGGSPTAWKVGNPHWWLDQPRGPLPVPWWWPP